MQCVLLLFYPIFLFISHNPTDASKHPTTFQLQYEIESREEVERCFVHIDYETRPYDEHVVSKVPELRERYRSYNKSYSGVSSI